MTVLGTNATVFCHKGCYLLRPLMESMRIVPISSVRSGQPANVLRMELDPTLIKIETISGHEYISGGDPRMLSDSTAR